MNRHVLKGIDLPHGFYTGYAVSINWYLLLWGEKKCYAILTVIYQMRFNCSNRNLSSKLVDSGCWGD